MELVNVFHAPFDEGLRLLIVSLLAAIERHPKGGDEPRIPAMIRVAWVSAYSFGSVSERVLDLSGSTEDSWIIRYFPTDRERVHLRFRRNRQIPRRHVSWRGYIGRAHSR